METANLELAFNLWERLKENIQQKNPEIKFEEGEPWQSDHPFEPETFINVLFEFPDNTVFSALVDEAINQEYNLIENP